MYQARGLQNSTEVRPASHSPRWTNVRISVEKFVFRVKDKKIVRTKEIILYEYNLDMKEKQICSYTAQ